MCPEGLLVAKEVARRVVGSGGAALIADYGQQEVKRHTLRVSQLLRHKLSLTFSFWWRQRLACLMDILPCVLPGFQRSPAPRRAD